MTSTSPTQRVGRPAVLIPLILTLVLLSAYLVALTVSGRQLAETVRKIEAHRGKLTIGTLGPPRVPDGRNRARVVRAAMELADLEVHDEEYRQLWERQPFEKPFFSTESSPTPEEIELARAIVAQNRLVFELLETAVERRDSDWDIPYEKGVAAEIPNLLQILTLSKLCTVRSLLAVDAGDSELAIQAIEQGFSVSASLAQEPILIAQLVRMGADRRHLHVLREILARTEPSELQLLKLTAWLEDVGTPLPAFSGLFAELKVFYFALTAIEQGQAADELPGAWFRNHLVRWLGRPILRADIRFYLKRLDQLVSQAAMPRYQRSALTEKLSNQEPPPSFFPISRALLPNSADSIVKQDLEQARLALARTAIGLRRYRLANGAYPDSLESMVPDYLIEIPVDPFTGNPVDYRPLDHGFALTAAKGLVEPIDPKRGDLLLRWEIPH